MKIVRAETDQLQPSATDIQEEIREKRDEKARDLLKGCVSRCFPSSNAT